MAWPTLFCETTSECSRTERILRSHDTVLVNPEKSKPIRNPSRITLTMISANSLSGWVCSTCSHARQSHGVETSERKAGVRRRGDGCISKRPVSGASLRCPNSRSGKPADSGQWVGGRTRVDLSHPKVERQHATRSYPDPICIRVLICPRSSRIHNVHNKGEA